MCSHDLDISFQLKQSDCMKRRQIVGTLLTLFTLNERREVGILENTVLLEYFSLYLLNYTMETHAK